MSARPPFSDMGAHPHATARATSRTCSGCCTFRGQPIIGQNRQQSPDWPGIDPRWNKGRSSSCRPESRSRREPARPPENPSGPWAGRCPVGGENHPRRVRCDRRYRDYFHCQGIGTRPPARGKSVTRQPRAARNATNAGSPAPPDGPRQPTARFHGMAPKGSWNLGQFMRRDGETGL